jgi:hypothetical protein
MYSPQGDGVEVAKRLQSAPVARASRPDDLEPQATKG